MIRKKIVRIDGNLINSESDFHRAISSVLGFGPHYGDNLDALWDMLSSGAAGGVVVHWTNSAISRRELGSTFDLIIRIFDDAKAMDERLALERRFDFFLD